MFINSLKKCTGKCWPIVAQVLHVRSVHQVVEGCVVCGEGGMEVLQCWFFHVQGQHAEVESDADLRAG